MELLSAELPKTHRIILAGDLHLGTLACNEGAWLEMLERVGSEPHTYLVLMGDLIEAIAVDDYRFSHEVHDAKMTPLAQADAVVASIKPVKRKVIACLTGNHEHKLFRYGDLTRYICDQAGVPYGGYSCKLDVRHGRRTQWKGFFTHGNLTVTSIADDPVRRLSNYRLAIKRRLQHLAGDAAIMATGHCHKLLTLPPERELYLTDDGRRLKAQYTTGVQSGGFIDPNLRWYCSTGSFLKSTLVGSTTYSEKAMYAPNQTGYCEVQAVDGTVVAISETRI